MNYHLSASDPAPIFKTGELVSRDGDDLFRVIQYHKHFVTMEVVCIRPPGGGWCKTGDTEFCAASRYQRAAPRVIAKP